MGKVKHVGINLAWAGSVTNIGLLDLGFGFFGRLESMGREKEKLDIGLIMVWDSWMWENEFLGLVEILIEFGSWNDI